MLFAILSHPGPQPQQPPAPLSKEIIVQSRKGLIPHVPVSVDQAHAEYAKVGPMISHGLQDLESELLQLYAGKPQLDAVPSSIRVHADEIEAAKFFFKMLNDKQYAKLQTEILKVWREWQMLLSETEPIDGDGAVSSRTETPKNEDLDAKKKLIKEKARLAAMLEMESKSIVSLATGGFGPEDTTAGYGYKIEMSKQFEARFSIAKQRLIVANMKAPQLAKAWTPFVEHLDACALKMAELDNPSTLFQGEDLRRLHLQAKVRFMERCRSALWFCQLVWARMTTNAVPPPLRELRPGNNP
jgi:hypothetical protein